MKPVNRQIYQILLHDKNTAQTSLRVRNMVMFHWNISHSDNNELWYDKIVQITHQPNWSIGRTSFQRRNLRCGKRWWTFWTDFTVGWFIKLLWHNNFARSEGLTFLSTALGILCHIRNKTDFVWSNAHWYHSGKHAHNIWDIYSHFLYR